MLFKVQIRKERITKDVRYQERTEVTPIAGKRQSGLFLFDFGALFLLLTQNVLKNIIYMVEWI